uniref:uncharacterized protein n=1 Tax=Myxine glutinosa TaxID=7769 RepID=UPI00358E5F52
MVRPGHELRALLVLTVLTVQAPVAAPLADCKNGQCERIVGLNSADLSSLLLRRDRPDVHVDPGVLSGRSGPGRGGEQFWLSHNTYRPPLFLQPRRAAIYQWLDSRKGHRPTSNSAEHFHDKPGLDMTISRSRLDQHSLDRRPQRGRSMNEQSGRNLLSKVLPVEVQQRGERHMLQDKTHASIKGSLLDLLLHGIGEHTRGDIQGEEQEVGRWEGAKAGSENVRSVSENRALPGLQKGNLPQAIGEEVHDPRYVPSSAVVEVGRGDGGAKQEGFMVGNRDSGLRLVEEIEQAMHGSELEKRDSDYGYIITDKTPVRLHEAWQLLGALGHAAGLSYTSFTDVSVTESVITFRIQQNPLNLSLADIADRAVLWRTSLHRITGIRILQVGIGQTDHDPRTPAYIAAQSPLARTISDFWQMVWENRCVVLVMLCPSGDEGMDCCPRYWPTEGSAIYHNYEVHLVSEHVCCEEYVVRSFYLKHILTGETRTVTQFHFLSWAPKDVPSAPYTLLEFRRKVNKCFRGRSCPIIVHCSDGSGHTGTYILLDMVLNRVAKGTKEIDIAATLEFIRDQRARMVETKEQFAFCLTAVAEEVNSILKSLPK